MNKIRILGFVFSVQKACAVLAVSMLVIGVANLLYTAKAVSDSNHNWCDLIHASLPLKPPVKPADPKKHPKAEKTYENYMLVIKLGHSLGCI
jgi:hypothetical protein